MKLKYLLIGFMLVLALCISPVAAVCGDGFEVVVDKSGYIDTYKYYYKDNPHEKYTKIYTDGTWFIYSKIMFRPADFPEAPMMWVDTNDERVIYLPQCVDKWEIRYYGYEHDMDSGDHLIYDGVVNLNEEFGEYIEEGLYLNLHGKLPGITCMKYWYDSPMYPYYSRL